MKKLIFIFALFISFAGLFAETGYKGSQWLTQRENLDLKFQEPTEDDILWKSTGFLKKAILGKETVIYYHFFEGYLGSISYTITLDKVKAFKKNMQEKVYEQKTLSITQDLWLEGFLEKGFIFEIKDKDLDLNNMMARFSLDLENIGYDALKDFFDKKGKGLITIYNYNSDTRIYLYENFITDQAIVVYVPHEQDY